MTFEKVPLTSIVFDLAVALFTSGAKKKKRFRLFTCPSADIGECLITEFSIFYLEKIVAAVLTC